MIYAIFVVAIMLAISFGISEILISQVKMLGDMGHSVVALYAADSGVEKVLIDRQTPNLDSHYYSCYSLSVPPCSLDNGSTYQVFVTEGGSTGDCPGGESCEEPPCFYYCIKSIGIYKDVKRAIEIKY